MHADAIADQTVRILTEHDYRSRMIAALAEVKRKFGGSGASDRAAEAVLETLRLYDSKGVR